MDHNFNIPHSKMFLACKCGSIQMITSFMENYLSIYHYYIPNLNELVPTSPRELPSCSEIQMEQLLK